MSTEVPEDRLAVACRALDLDEAHARHVCALSDQLYAQARHLHGLTKTARPLVEGAAVLHGVLGDMGPAETRPRLRDRLIRSSFPDLTRTQRRIVARAVELSAEDGGGEGGPPVSRTERERMVHEAAQRVAVVLRVACALNDSKTQETRVVGLAEDSEAVDLLVAGGPAVAANAARALERADLWNALLLRPIRSVRPCEGPAPAPVLFLPGHSVAEATRRILQQQLEQLLSRTYGLRYREDLEFVHEMRVALRRMRAALRAFRKVFGGSGADFKADLKWLADQMGLVRDLDVFGAFLDGYAGRAPEPHRPFVHSLVRSVQRRRRREYRKLLEVVQGARFRTFQEVYYPAAKRPVGATAALVPAGKMAEKRVASMAPRMLREQLSEVVKYRRRLDRYTPEELHALRIECKRLRYAAEFLVDVYPGKLKEILAPMEEMQDALGDVHDSTVYADRVARYRRPRRREEDNDAVYALLGELARRGEAALAAAAAAWKSFTRAKTQRQVAAIIKAPLKATAPA